MDARPAVLIMEDDESTRELLTDLLGEAYQVTPARDVLEAADLLQANAFDLLILDLLLPVMGGVDLVEIIRSYPQLNRTPILICSAYPDLISKIADWNVQGVLPKPFSAQQLQAAVAQALGRSVPAN